MTHTTAYLDCLLSTGSGSLMPAIGWLAVLVFPVFLLGVLFWAVLDTSRRWDKAAAERYARGGQRSASATTALRSAAPSAGQRRPSAAPALRLTPPALRTSIPIPEEDE